MKIFGMIGKFFEYIGKAVNAVIDKIKEVLFGKETKEAEEKAKEKAKENPNVDKDATVLIFDLAKYQLEYVDWFSYLNIVGQNIDKAADEIVKYNNNTRINDLKSIPDEVQMLYDRIDNDFDAITNAHRTVNAIVSNKTRQRSTKELKEWIERILSTFEIQFKKVTDSADVVIKRSGYMVKQATIGLKQKNGLTPADQIYSDMVIKIGMKSTKYGKEIQDVCQFSVAIMNFFHLVILNLVKDGCF